MGPRRSAAEGVDAFAPGARDALEGRGSGGNDVHGMPTVEGEHEWLCFTGDGTAIVGRGSTWETT